jgi:hypothetical protein
MPKRTVGSGRGAVLYKRRRPLWQRGWLKFTIGVLFQLPIVLAALYDKQHAGVPKPAWLVFVALASVCLVWGAILIVLSLAQWMKVRSRGTAAS